MINDPDDSIESRHTRGAQFVLNCFFWITFPYGQWKREYGFESWVWCMVFLTSCIVTFYFYMGFAFTLSVEEGCFYAIEQVRYAIFRAAWLFSMVGIGILSIDDMNRDYSLAHFPVLYYLPLYGTFIHLFFKPGGPAFRD